MNDEPASAAISSWWGRFSVASFGVAAALLVAAGLVENNTIAWQDLGRWLAWVPWLPAVLIAAGLGIAAVPAVLTWRARPRAAGPRPSMRPLRWWVIGVAAVIVGLATWAGIAWLLAEANNAATAERPKARIDAIRIGLSVGAATAGAAALLLAARRQWLNELGHAHQEKVSAGAEYDATERRITELYTTAVEQLGHEKAAVRLGGLHALERLAQNNPAHRQTVIDVLCAYLRMPIATEALTRGDPAQQHISPADDAGRHQLRIHRARRAINRAAQESMQDSSTPTPDPGEIEARMTAQRILTRHLRRPDGVNAEQADALQADPGEQFWPGYRPHYPRHSIDLTGAQLIDFNFSAGHVGIARFDRVRFSGHAWFQQATFSSGVSFDEATFPEIALFEEATFLGYALFGKAKFAGDAWFGAAEFDGFAMFDEATFSRAALFEKTRFTGSAQFERATFRGEALFEGARFSVDALFGGSTFSGSARFKGATFFERSWFDQATVTDPTEQHTWPPGWVVKLASDGSTRGVLRPAQSELHSHDDQSTTDDA